MQLVFNGAGLRRSRSVQDEKGVPAVVVAGDSRHGFAGISNIETVFVEADDLVGIVLRNTFRANQPGIRIKDAFDMFDSFHSDLVPIVGSRRRSGFGGPGNGAADG